MASQSNDAVDNALERLADTPEIRAIRLGQKRKRKRNFDDLSTRKFSEDEALKFYYNALAIQISKNWLDRWDDLENNSSVYDKDIRDAKLFNYDIATLNNEYASLNESVRTITSKLDALSKEFSAANEFNTSLENDKQQFRFAKDFFNGKTDVEFYFSKPMVRICENVLNSLIERTIQKGVYLTTEKLDLEVMGLNKEQMCIVFIAKNLIVLKNLVKKIREKAGSNSSSDAEIMRLRRQLAEERDKMEQSDEDGMIECLNKIKKIRARIDEISFSSSIVETSNVEEAILSKEILASISTDNTNSILDLLDKIISEWTNAIKSMFKLIDNELSKSHHIDISDITERKMNLESELAVVKDNIKILKVRLSVKNRLCVSCVKSIQLIQQMQMRLLTVYSNLKKIIFNSCKIKKILESIGKKY